MIRSMNRNVQTKNSLSLSLSLFLSISLSLSLSASSFSGPGELGVDGLLLPLLCLGNGGHSGGVGDGSVEWPLAGVHVAEAGVKAGALASGSRSEAPTSE